jgi:hypothetical protein
VGPAGEGGSGFPTARTLGAAWGAGASWGRLSREAGWAALASWAAREGRGGWAERGGVGERKEKRFFLFL